MNRAEIADLKHVMRDRINELTSMLRSGEEQGESDDEATSLDLLINAEISSTVSSAALRDLRLLKENLSWLDSEEGGLCEACGTEIASARLLTLPTTRLCVGCAGEKEQNE